MAKFSCPSCGAEVPFRSVDSVTAICHSCGTMLLRKDLTLESLGKIATLAEDLTPLQIGTIGKYRGVGFSVIGRVRVDWDAGSWNEWYIAHDNGKFGWLGEAQGSWAIYEMLPPEKTPKLDRKSVVPGTEITLPGGPFAVEDARDVRIGGIQGELPKLIRPGDTYFSADLTAAPSTGGSATATIGFFPNRTEVFVGTWEEFSEFHFTGMRELSGW